MLTLGVSISVSAQSSDAPTANAILVSQTRNGNVVTSRYKIPHNNDKRAEFDVHYAINKANIVESYSDNPQQIAELKDFMDQTKDTTMHITAIHIVGYASPDGNSTKNDTLAAKRAQSLYQYAINTFHPKQNIDANHKTFHWADCIPAVDKSNIPNKEQVLAILSSSSHTEPQKEAELRKHSEAWSYLATQILPNMRYADIEFDYGVDEFVTRTTVVPQTEQPKSVQTSQQQPNNNVIVEEEVGIIIATPAHDNAENREERREERKERKSEKKSSKEGYEVVYW